jgi:uncharacterized protein (UPF0335 family)
MGFFNEDFMAEFKRFRSTGEELRLVSTSGHCFLIGKDLVSIPDFLWKEAYSLGAVSEDMKTDSMKEFIESEKEKLKRLQEEERAAIKAKIKEVFDNPVGYVDNTNRPIVRKIVAYTKRQLKRDLIDELWDEILAESEG